MSSKSRPIVISTGNILTVNKKAGQKPVEELIDCLRATFAEQVISEQQQNGGGGGDTPVGTILLERTNGHGQVVEDNERSNIKIGAKIFLNQYSTQNLRWALEQLYRTLNVDLLDNLILAYHPTTTTSNNNNNEVNGVQENGTAKAAATTNGSPENGTETLMQWGSGHATAQADLISLWKVLEEYAEKKRITQLGIADLDTNSLKDLFNAATVRPTIAQINLQACCVVPPALQEFCSSNDIQLLTHSDPEEILSESLLTEVSGGGGDNNDEQRQMQPVWTTRYQVHLKCRGVLTFKGYLVGAQQ